MTRENKRAKIYSWQPTAHQQLDKVYWESLKYHQKPLSKACIYRSTDEIVQQNYEQTEFEESRPPSKVILKWTEFQRRNRWQQCSRFEQYISRRAISLPYVWSETTWIAEVLMAICLWLFAEGEKALDKTWLQLWRSRLRPRIVA